MFVIATIVVPGVSLKTYSKVFSKGVVTITIKLIINKQERMMINGILIRILKKRTSININKMNKTKFKIAKIRKTGNH